MGSGSSGDSQQKGAPGLSARGLLLVFLKLGLTSFGGPVAHLGYFREEFVTRRECLSEHDYADLVALCQFLPGPASSQVGIGIGISRAGIPGALAAWIGFTLPSAAALVLFAYGVTTLHWGVTGVGWLHGLKVVAVAVVAKAIWGMARTSCPDLVRGGFALLTAILLLSWPGGWGQIAAILFGGVFGLLALKPGFIADETTLRIPLGRRSAVASLVLFAVLLFGIPLLAELFPSHGLALFDSFYRTGSLVFGGGHVVLPLLQAATVTPGWVGKDLFLAGYGAAQAVPGPLFTFCAYLGAVMQPQPSGWRGAIICQSAIYLPSFLLLVGILPFWDDLRRVKAVRGALSGINAAVVGLLLAVFCDTVWSGGILCVKDFLLALFAFALLSLWRVPPWLVVLLTALGSAALAAS